MNVGDPNGMANGDPPRTKDELLQIFAARYGHLPQYAKYPKMAILARVKKGYQKSGTCWLATGDLCLIWIQGGGRCTAFSWRPWWATHRLDGTPRRDAKGLTPTQLAEIIGNIGAEMDHFTVLETAAVGA